MKIQGYCLESKDKIWFPTIPIAIVSQRRFFMRDGGLLESEEKVIIPIGPPMNSEDLEIPDNHWIGILADRTCMVLSSEEEPKWRVAQAALCIEKATRKNIEKSIEDTINNVNTLHAAAALVGIDISHLFETLAKARKSPNEPLEVTIRTIRDNLVK